MPHQLSDSWADGGKKVSMAWYCLIAASLHSPLEIAFPTLGRQQFCYAQWRTTLKGKTLILSFYTAPLSCRKIL
eukprot:680789-Ditylum_brightwellii.AAC.1